VLEGLRDALRPWRREWGMTFVVGPDAALEQLRREQYDAVVSDMGMPGMDGGELLARVRDLQPQAARIVMSGSVELNVVARAATVAHRVLAKPCKADDLMRIVARACELGELTAAESLRRAATSATGLPAAPAGYQRLLRALEDPDASAHSVARVLEQDVGMAAKVLQLANSAYFGARQPVSKLEQAVANVGLSASAAAPATPRSAPTYSTCGACRRRSSTTTGCRPSRRPCSTRRAPSRSPRRSPTAASRSRSCRARASRCRPLARDRRLAIGGRT
jgi:CheY-like chemotaxis protein